MKQEQHSRMAELLAQAMELAPEQRSQFLAQECRQDEALRREVESLLRLETAAQDFIEAPAWAASGKYCVKCGQRYERERQTCAADGTRLSLSDPYGLVGKTLAGRYRVEALVGMGGMGAVYSARQLQIDRQVAFKILLPHLALANAQAVGLFEREARTAGQLAHENVAAVFDAGSTEQGTSFMVMEWLEGKTLDEELSTSSPLSLERIAFLLRQICAALEAAHAKHIIHRDLKPSNIMLVQRADGSEQVKVLDFGIAKVMDGTTAVAVTAVMGTPHYASPEQLQYGAQIDRRTDIYSLGVVLYQMLTKTLPYQAGSLQELLQLQQSAFPRSISDFRPDLPLAMEQLIRRMMARELEQRPAQASEVVRLFEQVLSGSPDNMARMETSNAPTLTLEQEAPATKPILAQTTAPTDSRTTSALKARWNKISRYKLVGGVVLLLLLVAVGVYFSRTRQPVLTDKDTILLTDFVNTTGDAVFDGALKQGLAVHLGQSPFLNIFSDERTRETLRLMTRSPDERVTPTIGREICQRQGLKAMLTGTIASLGRNYVISLEAINGQTGEVLAREQSEAESKEQVLRSLGETATKMREQLGESLSSIHKFDVPIQQVTTSSLEALKVFALGIEQHRRGNYREATSFYQRAIELDPNFARAYVNLALMYDHNKRQELVNKCMTKAFELSERVSERERLNISQRYYVLVTGQEDKAVEVAQMWKQLYPRDPSPYGHLCVSYLHTGQAEKALEEMHEALRLDQGRIQSITYLNHVRALTWLNRFAEAKVICEQAVAQKLDSVNIHNYLYLLAFLEKDAAAMQKEVDWASGQPGEYAHLIWQAGTAAFAGQLQKASEYSKRAVELAQQRNLNEVAGEILSLNAERAAVFGNCQQSREEASHAATFPQPPTSYRGVGMALGLARCGDVAQAQTMSNETVKRYPQNTTVNEIDLPLIRAAIELQRGNRSQAIQILQAASRYESVSFFYQNYLRGQAYLGEHKGTEAAAEFQKILDHRGWSPLSPLYPLAHLGLGHAAAISGDMAKARKAYEEFFALWKDADADLPILLEAKKEYAKLK